MGIILDKRKGYSTVEQQIEANKKWIANNKEHRRYLSYRGTAKTFIRNYAKKEDLEVLKELISKREKEIDE